MWRSALLMTLALAGASTASAEQCDLDRADIDCEYVKPLSDNWFAAVYSRLTNRDDFKRSVALVIGIGDYKSYRSLSAPVADALRMREFLINDAGFDQVIILTDAAASDSRINKLLDNDLPRSLRERDRFLFYFSGHGETRHLGHGDKRGYLVLEPAADQSWDQMIGMPRVREYASNFSHIKHVLFLLDTCFSGFVGFQPKGGSGEATIERLAQPAHQMITAGAEDEESYAIEGSSLFTSAFLAAARGEGGVDTDGVISVDEIMVQIHETLDSKRVELGAALKMTPQPWRIRDRDNAGQFFFISRTYANTALGNASDKPLAATWPPVESKSGAAVTGIAADQARATADRMKLLQLRAAMERENAMFEEVSRMLNPLRTPHEQVRQP
jgi:Caspase domain